MRLRDAVAMDMEEALDAQFSPPQPMVMVGGLTEYLHRP